MPLCFIHAPTHIPFRNPPSAVDDPFGDYTSGEVAAMNREHIEDERFWREEHQ